MRLSEIRWWRSLPVICLGTFFIWLTVGSYFFSCNLKSCASQSSQEHSAPHASGLSDLNGIEICLSIKFVEPLQRLELSSSPQLGESGPYSVVYNYLRPSRFYGVNDTVTYTTHSTPEFMDHIGTVADRWDGPVSVAVYVPFTDFCRAMHRIVYLRNCDKFGYREKVSWHIYWLKDSPPPSNWRLVPDETDVDCSKLATDYKHNEDLKNTWRASQKLPYPVNVGRNIAKQASTTWYVLPSDVELYPSLGFTSQFMNFIKTAHEKPVRQILNSNGVETVSETFSGSGPRVYVVPVFEVQKTLPNTKEDLIVQYARKTAVYFHKLVCAHCQRFPGLTEWLQKSGSPGQMKAMYWSYRHPPYHRWEPIYVCTTQEPLYEEELTWEGLQDKMSQMHELCLRNYQFHLLDRGFLVHAVGIKKRKRGQAHYPAWRIPFIDANTKTYDGVMNRLENTYGKSDNCLRH